MPQMRLDAFFSSQEILSRKEVRVQIKAGNIRINGRPAVSPEQKIDPREDRIEWNGAEMAYKPFVYLMMNKPKGYVSSTDDRRNPTVLELVPPGLYRSRLFPAGRLDKDTTGFLLLTDDGDFAHRILSPKQHVRKIYEAVLDALPSQQDLERLEAGIQLADGTPCQGARVDILQEGAQPLVRIEICEGKYHQIKRMFGVLGIGVNALSRIQIGGLSLDPSLPPGGCREILHKELDDILFK